MLVGGVVFVRAGAIRGDAKGRFFVSNCPCLSPIFHAVSCATIHALQAMKGDAMRQKVSAGAELGESRQYGGESMSEKERIMRLMTAGPKVLARIDDILAGKDGADDCAGGGGECVRLLTLKDAAARLGLSRPTVYRLCMDGRLPYVQLSDNRGKRISVQAVADFAKCSGRK